MTTLPKMTKQFILSLDVKGRMYCGGYHCSVIHFTTGCNAKPKKQEGCRIPGIWIGTNYFLVHIENKLIYLSSKLYHKVTATTWSTIKIYRFKDNERYNVNMTVDGVLAGSFIDTDPLEHKNVKCFISDPWSGVAASSYVRNVWIKQIDD